MTGEDDSRPAWAVDLITQVAILNEKIPNHIEWVERNVKDHETRLRAAESGKVDWAKHDDLVRRVEVLEATTNQNSWLPKLGWAVLWLVVGGAVASGLALTIVPN